MCTLAKVQATRIDQDMAFAAVDAFGAVIPADATHAGRSNRLAVDDASTRLRIPPDRGTELLAQRRVEMLPRAVQTPQSEIVIGGLPGREFVRKQPPGTATPHHIEDRVEDLAHGVQPGPTDAFWRWE